MLKNKKRSLIIHEHPLTKVEVIENLILHEEALQLQKGTIVIVKELTEIYSDLIEYYDKIKDPITIYFKEKIQMLLSSKNTLKILDNPQLKDTVSSPKTKLSINLKKELRAKMIEFNEKLNQSSNDFDEQQKQSITQIIKEHEKSAQGINLHIKKELKTQEDNFNDKMNKRRERSKNRSLSRSLEMNKQKIDSKGDLNSSKFLKNLDNLELNEEENPFEK